MYVRYPSLRQFFKRLLGKWIEASYFMHSQPATPQAGITLNESGTYTDFVSVNTDGITLMEKRNQLTGKPFRTHSGTRKNTAV